jgi:hypothetical protein
VASLFVLFCFFGLGHMLKSFDCKKNTSTTTPKNRATKVWEPENLKKYGLASVPGYNPDKTL